MSKHAGRLVQDIDTSKRTRPELGVLLQVRFLCVDATTVNQHARETTSKQSCGSVSTCGSLHMIVRSLGGPRIMLSVEDVDWILVRVPVMN